MKKVVQILKTSPNQEHAKMTAREREFLEAEHVLYQDTVLKASTVKCQILIAIGIAKLATWPLLIDVFRRTDMLLTSVN